MKKDSLNGNRYGFQLTIKELLANSKLTAGNQEIVYRDKMRYTYSDLFERINRLGSALAGLGVKRGDTVAVFDYDSNRYLESFFAIPMMGAVLFTVNWRLSPDQIEYTMNHAEADVILINTDFLPLLSSIRGKLKFVKKVVIFSDSDQAPKTDAAYDAEYEELLAAASPDFEFPDLDENTKATTFYTTGTTGLPKGVYFSHRQIVLHTMSVCIGVSGHDTPLRFSTSDVYMPITPMFHVHAWGFPFIATMMGVKQVYPGKYEPEMLVKLIAREKVTFSHCVPTILQMIVVSPIAKQLDLSAWKVIIGGARLAKGIAVAAINLGISVMTGYGMSETCPVISVSNLKPYMKNFDNEQKSDIAIKTGMPIALVDVRIADGDGNFQPNDGKTTGEIVVRAPWFTKGYHKDPEKTEDLWRGGWLHTGDVGYMDQDGYIQITDRLKDVIKTGGEWVSSLDLENAVSMHNAIQEAAAIGVPDSKWGERPMLLVVLKPEFRNDGITSEVLKSHMKSCAEQGAIPRYAIPDQYIIADDIPKTSVGKVDKKRLRALYTGAI
ncbi:MAG TPA: fatty acid--CoA ligase [Smithellaceae bacterium]|jgi:fatty-acyl-CoA synthase|nr:MAG: Long-chain-fatty-acid--CoA ligase [Deltaproteobacteria bacterium ADurb.Bin002]HNV57773.1 fatty acid--CoA ligase [Smithellaceae bacterium]HNY97003.1 fatty acid--CoA ligase [Smithellaceae bacterium]HOD64555.1 fatty acid--CoA ligase [Smithellaceae bacterium]HOE23442.1 fatty acid--CoA ligase [Smithellaceae bacterium]